MPPLLWLALAIGSEIVATTSLKLSDGFTRLIPAVVVVGCAISFYALSMSLRNIPLGVVYAVWSGVGTAAIVLIGVFLFREVHGQGGRHRADHRWRGDAQRGRGHRSLMSRGAQSTPAAFMLGWVGGQ
jgi:small multidrug resistance pump